VSEVKYTKLGRELRIGAGAVVLLKDDTCEVEIRVGRCLARLVMDRECLAALRAGKVVRIETISNRRKQGGAR
jgi:invasion protein IalB